MDGPVLALVVLVIIVALIVWIRQRWFVDFLQASKNKKAAATDHAYRNDGLTELFFEMDQLWQKHLACKARFPFVPEDLINVQRARSGRYYARFGVSVEFYYDPPLTEERRRKINEIGHYLNQNFVIRLCSLLESHHIFLTNVGLDRSIDTSMDMRLLRLLRNRFAHSSGEFNVSDKKHRRLRNAINKHYGREPVDNAQFPLPIDTVLEPMFNACKDYARQFIEKQTRNPRQYRKASILAICAAIIILAALAAYYIYEK